MEKMNEDGKKLIDSLDAAAREFRKVCLAVKDAYRPIEEGGWNVHQLAVHVRDTDQLVYGMRARRTLTEDNPEFSGFDGEAYMASHYDSKESLPRILDGFVESIESLSGKLRGVPVETWLRTSRHESQGAGLTLRLWVERSISHIEEHLATVKKSK
jgi:hypothetical protein